MINNIKDQEPVRKMAGVIRNVFFLSLVMNIFEIYGFVRKPGEVIDLVSISLSIAGTVLIWLMSRAFRQAKKQALYFWLGACLLSYTRWIFIDASFQLGIFSIILMGLTIFFTVRIVTWVKNGSLA